MRDADIEAGRNERGGEVRRVGRPGQDARLDRRADGEVDAAPDDQRHDHRQRIGADRVDHASTTACSAEQQRSATASAASSASLPPMKTPAVAPSPLSSSTQGTSAGVEAGHLLQQRRDVGVGHELAEHQHQHDDEAGPDLLAAEHADLVAQPGGRRDRAGAARQRGRPSPAWPDDAEHEHRPEGGAPAPDGADGGAEPARRRCPRRSGRRG